MRSPRRRSPLVLARALGLRGVHRRRRAPTRHGCGSRRVLPAGLRGRAGRRRRGRGHQPDPARAPSRTTSSSPSRRPPRSRTPTWCWSSTGFQPAGRRRGRRRSRRARSSTSPTSSTSTADEHAEHGPRRATDPHFWLDPTGWPADRGRGRRAGRDRPRPRRRPTAPTPQALVAELDRPDRDLRAGLAGAPATRSWSPTTRSATSSGSACTSRAIAGLSPDAEPTPADLARLQDLIESDGITTVFSERLVSPRLAETLADDMGVSTAVLDPIEGLSDETSDEDYLSLMRENLSALELANGCPR